MYLSLWHRIGSSCQLFAELMVMKCSRGSVLQIKNVKLKLRAQQPRPIIKKNNEYT